MPSLSSRFSVVLLGLVVLNNYFATACLAEKYYPDHPKVQQMVERGVAFLSGDGVNPNEENNDGVHMLVGYAIFKVNSDAQHPRVSNGIAIAKSLAGRISGSNPAVNDNFVYTISVAGILLSTVDVGEYGLQIRQIRDFLVRVQKPNGGFGYLSGNLAANGDISQTQYAMLCLWTMGQLGVEVPNEPMVRCVNFMLRSQTNDGGWPYQFGDTGNDGRITSSLSAAGFSALLIAGDSLGMFRNKLAENQEEEGIIPIAFKRLLPEGQKPKADRTQVDASSKRCEAWFAAHPYERSEYHYYYMYSKERYESFLEFAKGKIQKSPDWYNEGVEYLAANQDGKGGWGTKAGDGSHLSPACCTAFSVLYLIRSTAKAIGELHESLVIGVGEIPDDVTTVNFSKGKIAKAGTTTSIDDALKMLEDDGKTDGEDGLAADRMLLATDPKVRKEQLNRFSRLLSSKDYKSRRIAAKMLGRGDDIDMVPALIYALTDPDPEVPHIAEKSLRLISRQLETAYLPKREKLTDTERAKAEIQWKKWFSSIRPDYVFGN